MTGLVTYFTSIAAAAIIGVVISSVITDLQISRLLKTVTGVLVLLVLLRPLVHTDLEKVMEDLKGAYGKETLTAEYEALYRQKLKEQITSTTEVYIQEKAFSIGAHIQAKVELTDDPNPIPYAVSMTGSASPEQRSVLQNYLSEQLGIDPENQRWNVYEADG